MINNTTYQLDGSSLLTQYENRKIRIIGSLDALAKPFVSSKLNYFLNRRAVIWLGEPLISLPTRFTLVSPRPNLCMVIARLTVVLPKAPPSSRSGLEINP